jgi:hypothetical protein
LYCSLALTNFALCLNAAQVNSAACRDAAAAAARIHERKAASSTASQIVASYAVLCADKPHLEAITYGQEGINEGVVRVRVKVVLHPIKVAGFGSDIEVIDECQQRLLFPGDANRPKA